MKFFKKHQLATVSVAYWFLLLYMVAALLWWFIELNNQNNAMAYYKLLELKKDTSTYLNDVAKIETEQHRKTIQYIGEGITFLLLILIVAGFVYRIVRRQLKTSKQQQNFMMAVTHELKTPIAITQLNLETLQKRKLDDETKEKLLTNTLQEANRLNNLCNNILFSAKLDEGKYHYHFQEIDLSNLLQKTINNFSIRFPQKPFTANVCEDIVINGEELLLQMLLNNLIENAIKYSPKNTIVNISLQQKNNKILFSVADEGIGIKQEEKKKVFEKFYRSGSENTRKTKGTGLGLYLCHKIVKMHKGIIAITDNEPCGSIFTVTFYI
ncbi:MAG: HAMP domain-containing histidine kinase [Bacteroidetes bacterium]|nr:HAMP domain-containing histidine kinase [Bacteroidota bacterium]MBS1649434.1 HAMP domain-containing histidine kinase [Bacteroidota bacterium]